MLAADERKALILQTLVRLSQEIGPRPAGSEGQRRSERYLADYLRACGLEVEIQQTQCPRWESHAISLRMGGRELSAVANPYAPACQFSAPLVCLQSWEELQRADLSDRIALLAGELTRVAFNPRNFDLFRDEAQDRIIATLEQKAPLAVILASRREVPVPLMEDTEFPLPSVTVAQQVGQELLTGDGQRVELQIAANRQDSFAANIIARGPRVGAGRLVLCAHYDTKFYTPGALDNASGVATLLALARLLGSESALGGIELVLFGGEDSWYPADAGYVTRNEGYFPTISTVVNVDGVGAKGQRPSVTFLACPEPLVEGVLKAKGGFPEIAQVEPWYDGDHSLFWPKGIPSLAVSSDSIHDLLDQVVHTPLDQVDQVDVDQIDLVVRFLHTILPMLLAGH